LRRRGSELGAGWQLKVPARSARSEISLPPQVGDDVPDRFCDLRAGALCGRALRPVAIVRAERVQHRLLRDDRLLVDVADDRVRGTAHDARATITPWREVELEPSHAPADAYSAVMDLRGSVADIEQTLLGEQARLRQERGQAVDRPRYLALLDEVAGWVALPPVAIEFDGDELRRPVRKAARKARKGLGNALEPDDAVLLHRARKAAECARYASELAAPVSGKKTGQRLKRIRYVQDVLGEHQDSVVAGQLLRRLSTEPGSGFTLGLLVAAGEAARREARADADQLAL
jgi:hypothetical protein